MDKTKAGYIEGTISIIANFLLFAAKMFAGIVTGSIALMADAWHTLSDSISSVVVIIAARLASRKADKEHPFGHGRWEQIASIFIGVFLAIIAYGFLENSIQHFFAKESVKFGTLAIAVTAASIAIKELLAQYAFYIARKTGNTSVKADAWHHRSDALSSLIVLIGILFAHFFPQLWWMDSALGAVIAIMLFYATWKIMNEAITKILGEEPDEKLVDQIIKEIKSIYNDDLQIHHIHLHNYINHKEITFHIRLKGNLSISTGHKIADEIERKIYEKFDLVSTIHVEPLDK